MAILKDDELTLRDNLALDRTRLANERTLLAYVRTAIMTAATGVTLIKLFPDSLVASGSGWCLLPLSLLMLIFAFVRFSRMNKSMQKRAE